MQTYQDKQFTARFNRIMWITFGVVMMISFALINIQVGNQVKHDDDKILQDFNAHATAIDDLVDKVAQNLNLMQTVAQSYFLDPSHESEGLFAALSNQGDGYSLDNITAPYSKSDVGNLTGAGSISALPKATKEEIKMALELNSVLKGALLNIPNAGWLYYTSKNDFINIYPWVPSTQSRFSRDLYKENFYKFGLPENNPNREIRWTDLYLDHYGKGMMVTATKPVYRRDEFIGTVSIDFNLDELNRYVKLSSGPVGSMMIVNDAGQLLAHPSATSSKDQEVKSFASVLPEVLRPTVGGLFAMKDDSTGRANFRHAQGYLVIWSSMQNTPWKIVYIAEDPNVVIKVLSKSGVSFLVLIGALTIMLATMRMITFREFIRPADRLVRHIAMESANKKVFVPNVPVPWLPWFKAVSEAFGQNRMLIEEINQKNQQLTDLNISLERYTPKFVLVLNLCGGSGATTVGNYLANTLAKKNSSKTTVFMEFPQPQKVVDDLGLDEAQAAQQVYAHPNGYDVWTAYDLGHVPEAGVTSLLMAKVLHKYNNVVINATLPEDAEAYLEKHLEPMFRYAKAIILMLPSDARTEESLKPVIRQIKKSVRQDQTQVYLLQDRVRPDAPVNPQADFVIPYMESGVRVTKERFEPAAEVSGIIGTMVDRVDRVHQVAVFIPSTIGVDRPFDSGEYVQRTINYFSERFGGATSSQAKGAWNSETAGIVTEQVFIVVSYTTEEDLSLNLDDLIDFIKKIKVELTQEAMAIEINKKLMLV